MEISEKSMQKLFMSLDSRFLNFMSAWGSGIIELSIQFGTLLNMKNNVANLCIFMMERTRMMQFLNFQVNSLSMQRSVRAYEQITEIYTMIAGLNFGSKIRIKLFFFSCKRKSLRSILTE